MRQLQKTRSGGGHWPPELRTYKSIVGYRVSCHVPKFDVMRLSFMTRIWDRAKRVFHARWLAEARLVEKTQLQLIRSRCHGNAECSPDRCESSPRTSEPNESRLAVSNFDATAVAFGTSAFAFVDRPVALPDNDSSANPAHIDRLRRELIQADHHRHFGTSAGREANIWRRGLPVVLAGLFSLVTL